MHTCVAAVHACTSFCLDTPDGPVFGCNLDLMQIFKSFECAR
jgi:hypothetical protein